MYKILFSSKVLKELNQISSKDYLKVREKILSLETEPRPIGSIKLTNEKGYRVRIGDFRILYQIIDSDNLVKLLKIGHRKDVYRKN